MLSTPGLKRRSDFIQAVRAFFLDNGYVEVDTPIRLPVLLPESEIIPFSCGNEFLHTSPELCMKRLLSRGAPRIFQICHCFRQHEMGQYHQTEFSLLEWYHAGWNYLDLMQECEQFVRYLAAGHASFPALSTKDTLQRDARTVSLAAPWQRMSVDDAFNAYAGMSALEALENDCFEEVLVAEVEPNLGWQAPVFLYDYPVELGSLARAKADAPHLAERFELYICGIELANGFSELVDPEEQRVRFTAELVKMPGHSATMPEKFLQDLEQMGETAGIALGIDRLLMLFMGAPCIADVLPFARDDL